MKTNDVSTPLPERLLYADAAKDYLNCIRYERGLSSRTCEMYASWLHHYEKWLKENGSQQPTLSEFSTPVLRRFLYTLSARKYRPRTIRGVFYPLRGLGDFLVENGVLDKNPVRALAMPKNDAAERPLVSTEEIAALLDAIERQHNPRQTALSRGLLSTLIFTGIRAGELLDLEVSHVSISEGTLLVAHGKGEKSRQLFPPPECLSALSEWLRIREKECTHPYLWAEDRGRRVGYEGLRRILEEVKSIAGLRGRDNIKCHSLRHAFATRLMTHGAGIKAIQAALGHSDAQTTFRYLHLEEQQIRVMASLASLSPNGAGTQPPGRGEKPVETQEKPAEGKAVRRSEFHRRRRHG